MHRHDFTGRNRAVRCTSHETIFLDFHPLVECGRATGSQCRTNKEAKEEYSVTLFGDG
jgi:hypothetical protein